MMNYHKISEDLIFPFEEGLKNADDMAKRILEKEVKNVYYVLDKEKNAYNKELNYIKMKGDVSLSTLAHEINERYKITKEYDFNDILKKCVKDGSVEGYLLQKYPHMFERRITRGLKVFEKYREISDIFSGLTIEKFTYG